MVAVVVGVVEVVEEEVTQCPVVVSAPSHQQAAAAHPLHLLRPHYLPYFHPFCGTSKQNSSGTSEECFRMHSLCMRMPSLFITNDDDDDEEEKKVIGVFNVGQCGRAELYMKDKLMTLKQPDVDRIASNTFLEASRLFPETTGFTTAIQDQVISIKNYKKHVLKAPNITNDIYKKFKEKLQTIQHITSTCRALAQGNYTDHHHQMTPLYNLYENF
jgi:hypothetical protein